MLTAKKIYKPLACRLPRSDLGVDPHISGPCVLSLRKRGDMDYVSRMGFLTQLKCNKVGIDKEKTSRMIVRGKLSERAVVKEDGLGRVYLQERR